MIRFSAPEDRIIRTGKRVTDEVTLGVTLGVTLKEKTILDAIKDNPKNIYEELSEQINLSRKTISKYVSNLKNKGILKRIGSKKEGLREIVK